MESSPGNDGDDQNDTGWSQPLTTLTLPPPQPPSLCSSSNPPGDSLLQMPPLLLTSVSLSSSSNPPRDDSLQMSPSLPTLPFEIITEILCRLPIKFLMTLKCVCKPWNSLISSDSKFAMKHLRTPTINPHLIQNFYFYGKRSPEVSHMVYPLSSFFTNVNATTIHATLINYPLNSKNMYIDIVDSCNGILCLIQNNYSLRPQRFISLWNPSTRKYNVLPAYDKPLNDCKERYVDTVYGFGFDNLTHKYKVVAVFIFTFAGGNTVYKTKVMVHTSGTDSWRLIDQFPFANYIATYLESGKFVSGTINWLVPTRDQLIVSLDLGTESYQQILLPHYGEERGFLNLGVLRDCLCVLAGCKRRKISDIWLMKEYGNTDSWTKIVTVPSYIIKVLYISEDDQMLLESMKMSERQLVVYDPINGALKTQDVVNFHDFRPTEIYVESLISPCS